jgi:hypothetical protein
VGGGGGGEIGKKEGGIKFTRAPYFPKNVCRHKGVNVIFMQKISYYDTFLQNLLRT